MIEDLRSQAEDLYFALRSDCDAATNTEIQNDFTRFNLKLERMVQAGDLKAGITKGLIKIITG